MVFRDFFTCGLRIPSFWFVQEVLKEFNLQIHHLTPNGILVLSKFCWACESYGATVDVDAFCARYVV